MCGCWDQIEHLDGDNKYSCSHCKAKHDATRQVVLKKVPDILSIGLLRFVFDVKTLSKKKVTTSLQFTETIDLSEYLPGLPKDDCVYDLMALLLHRGSSAYHGHYVAQIRVLEVSSSLSGCMCTLHLLTARHPHPASLACLLLTICQLCAAAAPRTDRQVDGLR